MHNNRIGGTAAADRNVISGNSDDGIRIDGAGADNNLVQGNYIGLAVNGTAALGNAGHGVAIFNGADNNTVGGLTNAARNVISANGNGITINDAGTTGNLVQGNLIGTDFTGTVARGNLGRGVSFDLGSTNNTIGGTVVGAGNTIANSGTQGVAVVGTGTIDNQILGNAIFANGGAALGIDLNADGVSANDLDDADVAANETKNFPVLTAAMTNGAGSATFAGSYNSRAQIRTYRIEFFANAAADPGGLRRRPALPGLHERRPRTRPANAIIAVTLATGLSRGGVRHRDRDRHHAPNETSEFSGAVVAVGEPGRDHDRGHRGRQHDLGREPHRQSRGRRAHLAARGDPGHERHRGRWTRSGSGSRSPTRTTSTTRTTAIAGPRPTSR